MDKMEMYEINSLMQHSYYNYQENWEMTRFLGYLMCQINTKKKLKLSDIITFDWDDDNVKKEKTADFSQFKRLKEKADMIIKEKSI